MKVIKIYYNKGYDVEILVLNYNLPPVIKYHGKTLKPFLKKSNSKWRYPMVNVPDHGVQYCHILVAHSIPKIFINKYNLKNEFPSETIIVDHKNGNTLDYSPNNLQFLTNSQNVLKAGECGENYMNPITKRQAKILKFNQ